MKKARLTSICNCVCALLLLVTLVMQFQPFWTCTKCKSHKEVDKEVSIAEYMWTPKHHKPITDDMTDLYKDVYGPDYRDPATGKKFKFKPNYILPSVLTVFVGSVAGILGCVVFRKKFFMAGIPMIVGIAGILGHLNYPALQVGHNTQNYITLYMIVIAAAAVSLAIGTVNMISKMKAKHKNAVPSQQEEC